MNFKKIGRFLLFLVPWFISSIIFRSDTNYYLSLNKPIFAPPPFLFGIIWPILYLLIAYVIYNTWNDRDNNYNISLLVNYISNQLFSFFFFTIHNPFLAFVDTFIILVSSIWFYKLIKDSNDRYSKYLIPYIIWNIYALILIFSIFIIN